MKLAGVENAEMVSKFLTAISANYSMSDSVESWSVARVQQWVLGLGGAFAQYAKNIDENLINGRALVHGLTSAEKWADAGITNALHQLMLAQKRSELLGKSNPAVPIQASAASDSSTIDAAEIRLASKLGAGHFGEAWLASFRGADVVVKRLNAAPSISDEKARALPPLCLLATSWIASRHL